MGDDTWISLFPTQFTHRVAFPSFNVKDLHTVDNGILSHLHPLLTNSAAKLPDVLVTHFLGVDHVGHRYSPMHPVMRDKLQQMDRTIAEIIQYINSSASGSESESESERDTLLVVLGDHGMSSDGNHGGASYDEINAALFAYSSSPIFTSHNKPLDTLMHAALHAHSDGGEHASTHIHAVSQIDLVPTLALLLGVPIPYGNIGALIPHFFLTSDSIHAHRRLLHAYERNVGQVERYIHTYMQIASSFSSDKLASLSVHLTNTRESYSDIAGLERELANAESEKRRAEVERQICDKIVTICAHYRRYLKDAAAMCREQWTTFNLELMNAGIVLLVCVHACGHTKRARLAVLHVHVYMCVCVGG